MQQLAPAKFEFWKEAAEQGNAHGQVLLGICFLWGINVENDAAEAVKWFRLAAEQGQAVAQEWLGICYRIGTGMQQDQEEAQRWERRADADSMH